MKVVLTKVEKFPSKKGDVWVNISYINPVSYQTGRSLISEKMWSACEIGDELVVPTEDLKSFLKDYNTVDIVFNERGRVEGILS